MTHFVVARDMSEWFAFRRDVKHADIKTTECVVILTGVRGVDPRTALVGREFMPFDHLHFLPHCRDGGKWRGTRSALRVKGFPFSGPQTTQPAEPDETVP
jgi:hypothetical protein